MDCISQLGDLCMQLPNVTYKYQLTNSNRYNPMRLIIKSLLSNATYKSELSYISHLFFGVYISQLT